MSYEVKAIADASATGAAAGAIIGALPDVAAILSITWLLIRIYEWLRVRLFNFPLSKEEAE
jgi:hypothetical protein